MMARSKGERQSKIDYSKKTEERKLQKFTKEKKERTGEYAGKS